jgi:hypothetical protein
VLETDHGRDGQEPLHARGPHAAGLEPLGTIGGIGGMLGSMGAFTYTMLSSSAYYTSPETGASYPMARVLMLRDRSNEAVPAYGLAVAF